MAKRKTSPSAGGSTPDSAVKSGRVDPSVTVQDRIVIQSNRVCALCWAFERDGRSKPQGQIAHIDRDNSNSAEDNLAWLCLGCHDSYDSKPQQSKRLRPAELTAHKASVEALVSSGGLPAADVVRTALLTVEQDFALLMPAGESTVFEVWCIFANEGERATGIKRSYVQREGEHLSRLGFMGDVDERGRPGKQTGWHPDGEYLFLMSDQMVGPGQCRMWAATFAPPRDRFKEVDLSIKNTEITLDPPLQVVFEPVIGSPILLEVSLVTVNPSGAYPAR